MTIEYIEETSHSFKNETSHLKMLPSKYKAEDNGCIKRKTM